MSETLLTNWSDYDFAVHRVLLGAKRLICVFDHDLARLKLEQPERIAWLRVFLADEAATALRIVIRDERPLRIASPRLMSTLADFSHKLKITECPPQLAGLRDSMLIADERSGVIRFHQDHARARLMIDEPGMLAPYVRRFGDILAAGGVAIGATTLRL